MALLNASNNYLRILEDGTVYFYNSPEDRANEQSNIIGLATEKYNEILGERYSLMVAEYERLGLTNDDYEERYDELMELYPNLSVLCDSYFTALQEQTDFNNLVEIPDAEEQVGRTFTFPIIEEYYPNIKNRIPRYFIMVSSNIATASADESYMKAKELGIFGETTDC